MSEQQEIQIAELQAKLDLTIGDRGVHFQKGWEAGEKAAEERIVAWLRTEAEVLWQDSIDLAPSGNRNSPSQAAARRADELECRADAISRGEHRKDATT